MPVAAKLSQRLHETLGAEAAEAMVDWMNRVETQRSELRELNELNFERIETRFGVIDRRLDGIDRRLDDIDARLGEVDGRFVKMEARFVDLEFKFRDVESTLRQEIHAEASAIRQDIAHLESRLERRFGDIIKWSFGFWIGSTVTLVVALATLARLGR